MKKYLAWILVCVCVIGLLGCGKAEKEHSFQAVVLEVQESYLLVKSEKDSAEAKSADKIEVSIKDKTAWPIPQAGDTVKIVYDGAIQETYPARIINVYRVEILESPQVVDTVTTELATYYEMSNGTWKHNDRFYRYRLVVSGKMPNTDVDTHYVWLSNLENITFEQSWKAAGLSSNLDDYFSPEEAVLVEWSLLESQ